jgi:N-sulfoglucosamine sulfohydrolase
MTRLSRRQLFCGIAASAVAVASGAGAQASKRTNILLVLADDWGWTSSRAVDELGVRTPNFDRVRMAGMTFNNAFSAAPSCTASRGAILTGRP